MDTTARNNDPSWAKTAPTRWNSGVPERTIVITPTYNERENLVEFAERVREHVPSADILVVDDNSPDGTGQLADEMALRQPGRFYVLHRERKMGLGRAYVAGFQWALRRGYQVIVQMDADLSHDPKHLPLMLQKLEGHSLVLGSRYLHGVNVINWDFRRLLLSKCASHYVQAVTGMPFTDPTGGYKVWRRDALVALNFDNLFATGYLFQVETTFEALRRGFKIAEAPIVFYERKAGASKMDLSIVAEAAYGVIRIASRRLRVFGGAIPALPQPASARAQQ
jgi:glycosyltransferase involved in cell wall biosynthesis